jgi:hypothetical protein
MSMAKWAIPLAALSIGFAAGWLIYSGPIGWQSVVQEGTFSYASGEAVYVYYPRPFAEPPALEINYIPEALTILEQRSDAFKIRGHADSHGQNIQWRARGKLAR